MTTRKSRLVWVLLGSGIWFLAQIFDARALMVHSPVLIVLDLLVVAAVIIRILIHRLGENDTGRIHVRLNAIGFVQDNHQRGREIVTAFFRSHGWLFAIVGAGVIAIVFCCGWIDSFQFGIWFSFALVVLTALAMAKWRYRIELSQLPRSELADRAARRVPLVSWKRVSHYRLTPTKNFATHRLCIVESGWFQFTRVVDAEIRCSTQQVLELRSWLDDRLGGAHRGTSQMTR